MNLQIHPLTPNRWTALVDLFGQRGACNGCWCMYWRIGAEYRRRPPEQNKRDFAQVVRQGPPPGLLAFDGDIPVGWCQLTPRAALPWMSRTRNLKPVDDLPVWSISCLYIRKGYRRRGITSALIAEALRYAKAAGAPALEAYPLDARLSPSATGTGYVSTFARAGFRIVAQPTPSRPIMRHDLETISAKH